MQPYAAEIKIITKFRFGPQGAGINYRGHDAVSASILSGVIAMSVAAAPAPANLAFWRKPWFLIIVGCTIALIAFGPRSALGQFLSPLSFERGWGREAFSLAIGVQNLLWGAAQPFSGAIADRFGPVRVLCVGAILYAVGLAWMSQATTLAGLNFSAGVMIGFG